MNTENIYLVLLQQLKAQLKAQLQNLEAQAQPESELKPLTKNIQDTNLANFMSTSAPKTEDYEGLDYGEIFLCNAFKTKHPNPAFKVLSNIYSGKELDQGVCGKKLFSGMIGYTCLDCQMDSCRIICKECFENGDHTGHRFQIKQQASGMCDCGDPDAWKAEGNCSKHNGFINEDDYMSKEQKISFINAFKRAVFYIVQGFELNKSKAMRKKYSKDFKAFVETCKSLKEEYPTLACLMGRAFCENFEKNIEGIEGEFCLNHDCEDLSGEHPEDPKPQKCNCSVVKALMRYIIFMGQSTQKVLTSFFMGLFLHEEFKTHMAVEYLRMINFIINWNRIGKFKDDEKAVSQMSDMCIQLMNSEHLSDMAIEKATMRPFFEGLIKLSGKYISSNGYIYFDNLFLININLNINNVLMNKSGLVRTLKDRESIKLYFLFLEEINKKKARLVYTKDDADLTIEDNINSVLSFEFNTVRYWIEFMSNIVSHDPSETEEALFTFLDEAKESIFRMQAYDDENFWNNGKEDESGNVKFYPRTYSIPLHRMFIVVFIGYVYFKIQNKKIDVVDFDEEKLENLVKRIFRSEIEKNRFWYIMTQSFSGALGFNREMKNSLWNFYGPIKERFRWIYYNFRIHNFDFVGLQFCNYFLKDKFPKIAFESFFNTPIGEDLIKGNFKKAFNSFDSEKDSDKQQGLFATYGDFFRYLNEILQNEINITFIIELYLEEIKGLFKCLPLNSTSTKGMAKAKIDFLFSALTGSPSQEASKFLKNFENYTEDKSAIGEFMQNSADINRQKQTVQINRVMLHKEAKKIMKTEIQLNKKDYESDTEISLTARPNCELLWYDPNKRGEIGVEIREKMELEFKKIAKEKKLDDRYHPHQLLYNKTYTNLLKILKSNSINTSKFLIGIIKNLNKFLKENQNDDDKVTSVGNGTLVSALEDALTPIYLHSIILLDNFNPKKNSELEKAKLLIKNLNYFFTIFSETLKDNYNFKNFKKKVKYFSVKYTDEVHNPHNDQETQNEEAEKEKKEKRAKLLAERKKKLKNKFSAKNKIFMENLIMATDNIVNEIRQENTESDISCVADNSKIPKDGVSYILGHFTTSNVKKI